MLLLTTTHYQMLTLALNLSAQQADGSSAHFSITSDSLLDLRDRHARPADDGQIVIIDPTSSIVCCHLYQGLLKCVTVNPAAPHPNESASATALPRSIASTLKANRTVDKTFLDQFSLPIEEVTIMSMVFLYGCQRPTLAVLFQDKKEIRNVKTYEFDLKCKDKVENGWIQSGLSGARTCVAVPTPIGNNVILWRGFNKESLCAALPLELTYFNTLSTRWTAGHWRVLHLVLQPSAALRVSIDRHQLQHSAMPRTRR